jgi:transposase-like protein
MNDEAQVRCPKCNSENTVTAVHQFEGKYYGLEAHIVDMGWKCQGCGTEFGFETSEEING